MAADELTEYLLHESRSSSLSPEILEMMGKEAANLLLTKGVALNESISKLAAAHPGINAEHIQRVCEFANNSVYLAKHDQNKTAGANASYPQFVLADASRIVQDMSDGARPTQITPTDIEYGMQPQKREKIAAAKQDEMMEMLFPGCTEERQPEFSKESSVNEVFRLKHELVDTRDTLAHEAERCDLFFKQASEDYYRLVRNHLLEEGSLAEVMFAASSVGAGEEKTAEILQPVIVRLMREKIASPQKLKEQASQLDKLAHRVINPDHPLVANFSALVQVDAQIEKIAGELQELENGLGQVQKFIKESYHAGAAR